MAQSGFVTSSLMDRYYYIFAFAGFLEKCIISFTYRVTIATLQPLRTPLNLVLCTCNPKAPFYIIELQLAYQEERSAGAQKIYFKLN